MLCTPFDSSTFFFLFARQWLLPVTQSSKCRPNVNIQCATTTAPNAPLGWWMLLRVQRSWCVYACDDREAKERKKKKCLLRFRHAVFFIMVKWLFVVAAFIWCLLNLLSLILWFCQFSNSCGLLQNIWAVRCFDRFRTEMRFYRYLDLIIFITLQFDLCA